MQPSVSLAAHDISCQRGAKVLFERLSFVLGPGEALLVTGPNGAGKTSLLRMIAGLLPLQAGKIEGPSGKDVPLPELCHYVGHLNSIKSALSLRENIAFWVDFLGGTSFDLDGMLVRFGLSGLADLPAGLLSAGQKRNLLCSAYSRPSGRSGCSTSPPCRSTYNRPRYSARRSRAISPTAASRSLRATRS